MTWVATIDSRTKFVIQALRRESIATFDYRNFQHLIFKLAGEFAYDQVHLVLKVLPITLSFSPCCGIMSPELERACLRLIPRSVICAALLLSLTAWNGCRRETPAGRDDAAVRRERGTQIVAEYLKRDASPYRKNRVRLTITAASEPVKVYELEIWRKQTAGETLTLTHVVQPAGETDLAALSVERKGEPTVNVTYVSSADQFRETGTNKMFFGGLTAQELLGEWDKYDYNFLAEKDLDLIKSYEVEGVLKPSASSIIGRTRTLFRADTYLPVEMHLLDPEGKELRTFRVTKYSKVAGRDAIWVTAIENHIRPTRITIESLSLEWPEKLDDAMFTRARLKQLALRKN